MVCRIRNGLHIRSAFILAIPVILAGSVALIVQSLLDLIGLDLGPINFVRDMASLVYNATFGILSVIMTALICVKNLERKGKRVNVLLREKRKTVYTRLGTERGYAETKALQKQ